MENAQYEALFSHLPGGNTEIYKPSIIITRALAKILSKHLQNTREIILPVIITFLVPLTNLLHKS
jgi:hypothetical protein